MLMGLFKSVINVFELIYDEGLREWLDETKFMEVLDELYSEFESGKISEAEYEAEETKVLEQLKEVRRYKRENDL